MKIPLFPLQTAVLFPRARMPLHIFEPRYRHMLADAIAADNRIAMGLAVGPDEIRLFCGVGRIVGHETFADGTSDIVLLGETRARILGLSPEGPYLVADLEPFEEPSEPRGAERLATQLRTRLEAALRTVHGEKTGRLMETLLAERPGAGGLADLAAELLLANPLQRQRVLEALDPLDRLRALAGFLGIPPAPSPISLN